jgi:[FeFe] hydrogenase (group B1/B3)
MRGVYSAVEEIRRKVFTEVARLAYEDGPLERLDQLPYEIIPGPVPKYRGTLALERAIIGQRLRLAMGLPLLPEDRFCRIADGAEAAAAGEDYYEPPLVNVIKIACNSCPHGGHYVTDLCQGCLEHFCQVVCPRNAISIVDNRSVIDKERCVSCGKCANACPYSAIVEVRRPCAKACGVDAISTDEFGRAQIDPDKCVSCGMCLVSCPFGAIGDKCQIYPLIHTMRAGTPVVVIVAPAFVGQFGKDLPPTRLRAAMEALGFADVVEVARGADLCTMEEAEDFLSRVPDDIPFMGTSCCPSWYQMAHQLFPDQARCISMAMTPMILTARAVKRDRPDCKVAFLGPCSAKKLEAIRIRGDVDYVLTFEEVMGMCSAKNLDFSQLPEDDGFQKATGTGRGYAVAGGVARAVVETAAKLQPDRPIPTASAQGLRECRKLLTLAKAGKYNGYLLEGMACPGGCVAGAGTIQPVEASAKAVQNYEKTASRRTPADES